MQYAPNPPYDFARTLEGARTLFVAGHVLGDKYRRTLRVGNALALVEITSSGTDDAPQLEARLLSATGVVNGAALYEKVARVLNVGSDLKPFYAAAAADPVLAQTVERLYGLHSLQADTMFEALLLTMIEQQIALKMAQAAERWLLAWGGESLTYEGETYYAFPGPERIASATVADLTPLKITFGRMQRMIDLSQRIVSGQFDLEALRDQPAEVAYHHLLALPGVGHWTATWTLFRAQGYINYVGSTDVALQAAVNHFYHGLKGRADVKLVEQTFARYGDFAGMAAYYTQTRWAFEKYS